MISEKKILAVIPARGGSKGVPRKNIREVNGKPLIAWTIEEARKSKYIDRLILSSEDDEIIQVAKKWGCEVPFKRPWELAQDNTPGVDPVLHAIGELPGYDYVVLLQPTSPLRKAADIDGSIQLCVEKQANSCVSVTVPDKSPYWMYNVGEGERLEPVIKTEMTISRRQDLPEVVALNGAVYVSSCDWLKRSRSFITPETIAFQMPKERSLDIDTENDLKFLEWLGAMHNE